MSEIDHEAAKAEATKIVEANKWLIGNDFGKLGGNFISMAYLDLQQQLAAERERVQKLAKLVRDAYEMDHCFYDDYIIGEPIPFEESDAAMNLAAILNAQETHNA